MKKPVIYLCDENERFLESLLVRLLTSEGRNSLDYEIHVISTMELFYSSFKDPSDADVVVIPAEWYLRHEDVELAWVNKVIVLTGTDAVKLQLGTLFKNGIDVPRESNLNRIVNEILSGLPEATTDRLPMRIVAVDSAVGGSGTTLVSLAMAKCFAQQRRRVLYLSMETIQSFNFYMDPDKRGSVLSYDACNKLFGGMEEYYRNIKPYLEKREFSWLPPVPSAAWTMQINVETYLKLIREAAQSGDFDVIVLDMEKGSRNEKYEILAACTDIVVIVLQDMLSVMKTDAMLSSLDRSAGTFHFVCNRYKQEEADYITTNAEENYVIDAYLPELSSPTLSLMAERKEMDDLCYMI